MLNYIKYNLNLTKHNVNFVCVVLFSAGVLNTKHSAVSWVKQYSCLTHLYIELKSVIDSLVHAGEIKRRLHQAKLSTSKLAADIHGRHSVQSVYVHIFSMTLSVELSCPPIILILMTLIIFEFASQPFRCYRGVQCDNGFNHSSRIVTQPRPLAAYE